MKHEARRTKARSSDVGNHSLNGGWITPVPVATKIISLALGRCRQRRWTMSRRSVSGSILGPQSMPKHTLMKTSPRCARRCFRDRYSRSPMINQRTGSGPPRGHQPINRETKNDPPCDHLPTDWKTKSSSLCDLQPSNRRTRNDLPRALQPTSRRTKNDPPRH